MMNEQMWKFSQSQNIENASFNELLKRFYEMGISGLVRENIQNSLDGALRESTEPVKVTIEIGEIAANHIPGINDIKSRIHHLNGGNDYSKETIDHLRAKSEQKVVNYITFEDENTKGLTGARNGQSNSRQDTWGIYAYNTGVHFKENDEAIETARGGSHGVGKIASNAASDMHVMYFSNCDENGSQHIGGTVQLIEHQYGSEYYRSTGYFTDVKNRDNMLKYVPYANARDDIFSKKTRGLKVIIPFLRDDYNDELQIIKSVCDGFFLAILQGNLEVVVNGKAITGETIKDIIKDPQYYAQDVASMKKNFTPLYLDTYTRKEPIPIEVTNNVDTFHFQLHFTYNEEIVKGRVAIIRTIGMKIEDFGVPSYKTKPFNAVLLGGPAEDAYLKSLENESHTALSSGHINNKVLKRNANKFIKNLGQAIAKVYEETVAEKYPADEMMDTSDALYTVEVDFKKTLEKGSTRVKLKSGAAVVQRTNVTPSKERRDPAGNEGGHSKSKGKRKREPLKKQKGGNKNRPTNELQDIYEMETGSVERILLGDRELLKFDFRGSKKITQNGRCNLILSVIDGMGKEIDEGFNVSENYETIFDTRTRAYFSTQANKIMEVPLEDGIVELELGIRERLDRALKFVYYVEVQHDL